MKEQAHKLRIAIRDLTTIVVEMEGHDCRQNLIIIKHWGKHKEKLTPNFYIGEYGCRDGTRGILIDKRMSERLQAMREAIGKPIHITSAYRNPEHNEAVGGADESRHMDGCAVDIAVIGMSGAELADWGRRFGFNGIGIASTWCHLDVRDKPAEWRY